MAIKAGIGRLNPYIGIREYFGCTFISAPPVFIYGACF